MDLISILMPVYNVAPYVEEAVNSILNQTYLNFELIIVDDCSTDLTYEIVEKLAAEDSRIKLYKNQKNLKICKTLNRAWKVAKGSYIARMDGDDISLPNRLEILKRYLDTNPQCDLVGSGMITIDEYGNELSSPSFIKNSSNISKYMKYRSCIAHIWMSRREVYESLDGYRELPYVEDYDFLLRALRYGYILANVDAYIYKCRIRQGNTGSTNGLSQHLAKRYVTRLWKRECKAGKELFSQRDYEQAIESSYEKKIRFQRAREHLNIAVHHKNNKIVMIYHTLVAMTKSYLIFLYIIDSIAIRIGVLVEQWEKKREK